MSVYTQMPPDFTNNEFDKNNTQTSLPTHYSITLDNGLQVVAIPLDNHSNVIQSNVIYKVGSRNEVLGKSGIAHMLEHLNFKSTKNLKTGEFDEIVKGFGGTNNASTGFDYTNYYINSTSNNLDKSLELFAELMMNLELNDDEFQTERNVVAEERLWRTDNSPFGYLFFRFFNTAFTYHPYHWTAIGFMDDIKNWKIEDIKDFYNTYYQPQNAIVLVSGDIDKDKVFESAKKHFGNLKNKTPEVKKVRFKEPPQDGMRRSIVKKDSQVEMMIMGYKTQNITNKEQVALSVLAHILSFGNSSKFNQILLDKLQIASYSSASNLSLQDGNIFIIEAMAMPNVKMQRVEKEILDILDSIKQGNISQSELDKIRINTKAMFLNGLGSAADVSSMFAKYLARGNVKCLLEYESVINEISIELIQEVANKYLIEDNLSVVTLQNKGE